MSLLEALGRPADAKLLIVSCDDLGCSHAANVGVFRALRDGWATTAGLMVPAPWAREAAARYRGEDVGVHVTLNADYEMLRWGPLTQAPSLLGGDGGFPKTVSDLWDHADVEEARRECKAQAERAIYWGFDITHLDSHLGALSLRPEFFDIALDLAVELKLPLRLPDADLESRAGFPFRRLAAAEGVLSPDRVVTLGRIANAEILERTITNLEPGVTEISFRPAADTPELRALTPDWPSQITQAELLEQDSEFPGLIHRVGAQLIGYRELRDAQRRTA